MKKVLSFVIPVAICFLVGFTASQLQTNSVDTWYPYLNKPSLTPPDIAFPIAWNILYLCMGLSIGFILISDYARKRFLIGLFIAQLILNFAWTILFFNMRNPLLALVDIILLEVIIVIYAIRAYPVSKISSYLFIPYILWITFAAYLNLYIFMFN